MKNIILDKLVKFVFSVFVALLMPLSLFAESVADKAKRQQSKNINAIVFLEVPIKNFGTEDQIKNYKEIKFKYGRSLAFYFENNFLASYRSFIKVQKSLEEIYEKLSIEYINRTELILQKSLQALVEIKIRYHRKSNIIDRILTNIEPPNERPYYIEKELHFVYDKQPMTRNMDRAYYLLGHAKRLHKKSINLIKNLKPGKPVPPRYREKRVVNYQKIIEICRLAKRNGIRVHQYINQNKLYQAEPSYRKNPAFYEKKIAPIFDTSIPKDYVVDLNDSYNKIQATEVDYKLLLKNRTKDE